MMVGSRRVGGWTEEFRFGEPGLIDGLTDAGLVERWWMDWRMWIDG